VGRAPRPDRTVPLSWPEALELLSAELGEPVTFRVAAERQFLEHLTGAGIPAGTAELLITREWAILAGENDYTTGTFGQITGRPPSGSRVPALVPPGIRLTPARRHQPPCSRSPN
jgi:hypothetical protein